MFYGHKYCNNFRKRLRIQGGPLGVVFKYIDILGESAQGLDGAVQNAIEETARTVKDIRTAEVLRFTVIVSNDKIVEYQALMRVAFKVKR
jgi:dodecin